MYALALQLKILCLFCTGSLLPRRRRRLGPRPPRPRRRLEQLANGRRKAREVILHKPGLGEGVAAHHTHQRQVAVDLAQVQHVVVVEADDGCRVGVLCEHLFAVQTAGGGGGGGGFRCEGEEKGGERGEKEKKRKWKLREVERQKKGRGGREGRRERRAREMVSYP